MKILGLCFLLSLTNAFAQEVIESAPLSVQDDGSSGRPIVDRKDGTLALPEEKKEIIKVEPVEVKPESLEELNEDIIKITKTKKKSAKKEVAQKNKKSKKVAQSAKRFTDQNSVEDFTPVAEAPTQDGQLKLDADRDSATTTVAPAPVVPAPIVNSQDGQLKLDVEKTADIKIEDKVEAPKDVIAPPVTEVVALTVYERLNPLKKYLQFSFGYLNSKYDKIDSGLKNGSMLTSFRFVADMSQKLQSGFAIEILNDRSDQKIPDNIRAIQYRLFFDYHTPVGSQSLLHWVGGIALSVGDYGIKRRYLNDLGQEIHVELSNGLMFGLIPSAGLRFYLVGQSSFDLVVEYHQYFGKPQRYIGGLAFSPRLSFVF